MKPLEISLALAIVLSAGVQVPAATYYVDSKSGDDSRTGVSQEQSWRTLGKVNAQKFVPGDQILFKAGQHFSGQLAPQGSGQIIDGKANPIIIGMYGGSERPCIDGKGAVLDTVLLRNVEIWDVQDLEITNLGTNRVPWRTSVRIISEGFGTMRHIHLRNLFVHDVNGDLSKKREGCGIFFETKGGNESRFDDLLIENCHLLRTDRNGICERTAGGPRSTHVVIRGNLLEDIGGDGIKPWGSDGTVVEHNILRGGRTRCEDYAAGIWPFDCDDTVIQFNEVSGMKGDKDGQAFDSDYRCRRSLFQYNYSHENEGGFMLICGPGNSWNDGTVIRFNISQNDGIKSARVFHFGGGSSNTQIYNNTIYVGPNQDLPLFLYTEWDKGNAKNTYFFNNLFLVDGHVTYNWGKSANNVFENNVFAGAHSEIPHDPHAITNWPALRGPGKGGDGFGSLDGYKAKGALPKGRVVSKNGGRDFFGSPLPSEPFVGCAAP